jgi:methyl-accepting chemotaxis protein
METTGQALGATVDSVKGLSTLLSTTAASVQDTKPVLTQINKVIGETMPTTLRSATDSLEAAQQAAQVMEGSIQSLNAFRSVISATPFLSSFAGGPVQPYSPEKPLADSLGELAANLKDMPATFTDMASNLDKADNNLDGIQSSLTTMSGSVDMISKSLGEYQAMVSRSKSSMDNLKTMLANVQNNLTNILNIAALVVSLFLVWLLMAQVVIFSQGWELFQGTAGRMEGGATEVAAPNQAAAS